MENLKTNLKIFEIEDGETHWIVAENKKDAAKWYEDEYVDTEILEEGYEITELPKDTKMEINVNENQDLINIMNRYRNKNERIEHIGIWLYLKYLIVEEALKGNEFEVPNMICSTSF